MLIAYEPMSSESEIREPIEKSSAPTEKKREQGRSSNPYLRMLRESLDSKNLDNLRIIVDAIQNAVHKNPKLLISSASDSDLRKMMESGDGLIPVGTGTLGERIYIRNGKLFMPERNDQEYSKRYYDNFRYVFDLDENQELSVEF